MRVIVCDTYEQMSKKAARIVAGQINLKPDCVLGFATGSTPLGTYKNLIEMNKSGEIDFSEVKSFNLDEYYPIKRDNKQSYRYFMNENLFNHINIDMSNTHVPNGETENPDAECDAYERAIKEAGGVDLQILGIGENGHIGFNEPDACLDSFTHLASLTESTISANSRFFGEDEKIPTKALTMGISTILNAKKIILLASGANKNRVVTELLNDEINTSIPASMLKTHPDVVLICDHDAYTGARLGIDIGGMNIKYAVVDKDKVIYKNKIETPKTESEIIDTLVNIYDNMKAKFDVKTLGIGTPGIIKNGEVTAVNLPFKKTPLKKLLKKRINLPIVIDNDANCAALGEVEYGTATDCDNIVLIVIGTGIGGGVIMNRQICRGKYSMGEIGHIIIEATNGIPCPCGQNGCWEQYVSARALMQYAEEKARENKDSLLYEIYTENGNQLDGEKIFEAIDKNCPVAKAVFDRYLNYFAAGINSIVNVFGTDAIILAGGITAQGDNLLKPLKEKLNTNVRIEISTLQNDAGALGAAML